MTANPCPVCGRPVRDGVVCHGCADQLRDDLRGVPTLLLLLEPTIARQARYGGRVGSRSADKPLPYHEKAADVAQTLSLTVTGWGRVVAEENPAAPPPAAWTTTGVAAWLVELVEWLRQHPAADDVCRELRAVTKAAYRVVDRPAPQRTPVGVCPTPGCGHAVEARPDDLHVACRVCGTLHDVGELWSAALDRAETALLNASRLAWLAATAFGLPITAALIRQWAARGRLASRGVDEAGHAVYRVGDVFDLAQASLNRVKVGQRHAGNPR